MGLQLAQKSRRELSVCVVQASLYSIAGAGITKARNRKKKIMWAVHQLLAAAVLLVVSTSSLVSGKTVDHISLGGNANNCDIVYETIVTQKCSPTIQKECQLVVFENERVEYNRQKCVEVTSVHCSTTHNSLIQKREASAEAEAEAEAAAEADAEAEADPFYYNQWYQPAPLYQPFYQPIYQPQTLTRVPAAAFIAAQQQQVRKPVALKPVVKPVSKEVAKPVAKPVDTHDDGCHKVTSEHCYKVPTVIKEPTEIKKCHDVTKMKCTPFEHKVPKTICKPVKPATSSSSDESVAVTRVSAASPSRVFKAQPSFNPFAYDFRN